MPHGRGQGGWGGGGPRLDRAGRASVATPTPFDPPEANHHFDPARGRPPAPPAPLPPWIEAGNVHPRCPFNLRFAP